ncbi:MAG: dTDP-4-dehydrorhamnose 3,5-epimerase family protein [Deltaproteobacteria bacterium]|nr:dTDP-4-dehydrorhamnose 3,5-epimerase family protein [Deltaproteobacteria bacterium]
MKELISGVETKTLKVIPDERGRLMEILRNDDPLFKKFGQLYMTVAYHGVVKGWHYHKSQWDNFSVVKGMIKLVLYDSRPDSPTYRSINEFFIGEHHPLLVQIPPYVYHGFKGITHPEAIVINCPSEAYHYEVPDEFRVHPHNNDIPYQWALKEG